MHLKVQNGREEGKGKAQLESNEFIGALSSLELDFIYLLCR